MPHEFDFHQIDYVHHSICCQSKQLHQRRQLCCESMKMTMKMKFEKVHLFNPDRSFPRTCIYLHILAQLVQTEIHSEWPLDTLLDGQKIKDMLFQFTACGPLTYGKNAHRYAW